MKRILADKFSRHVEILEDSDRYVVRSKIAYEKLSGRQHLRWIFLFVLLATPWACYLYFEPVQSFIGWFYPSYDDHELGLWWLFAIFFATLGYAMAAASRKKQFEGVFFKEAQKVKLELVGFMKTEYPIDEGSVFVLTNRIAEHQKDNRIVQTEYLGFQYRYGHQSSIDGFGISSSEKKKLDSGFENEVINSTVLALQAVLLMTRGAEAKPQKPKDFDKFIKKPGTPSNPMD